MGIAIKYKGQINSLELISPFIGELIDISKDMNWHYTVLDEDLSKSNTAKLEVKNGSAEIKGHLPLKGIGITPHNDCESLSFFFDANRNIRDICLFTLSDGFKDLEYSYVSIKTQYSPVEVHITIIKLLKYLKKKYLNNLEVIDEGEYWETEDKEHLEKKIEFLSLKIEMVSNILKKNLLNINENHSAEDLVDKIEKILKEKLEELELNGALHDNRDKN